MTEASAGDYPQIKSYLMKPQIISAILIFVGAFMLGHGIRGITEKLAPKPVSVQGQVQLIFMDDKTVRWKQVDQPGK